MLTKQNGHVNPCLLRQLHGDPGTSLVRVISDRNNETFFSNYHLCDIDSWSRDKSHAYRSYNPLAMCSLPSLEVPYPAVSWVDDFLQ